MEQVARRPFLARCLSFFVPYTAWYLYHAAFPYLIMFMCSGIQCIQRSFIIVSYIFLLMHAPIAVPARRRSLISRVEMTSTILANSRHRLYIE